ncbi:MAG: hypothetical protein AAF393_07515 [Pseudomonadota bacterium]
MDASGGQSYVFGSRAKTLKAQGDLHAWVLTHGLPDGTKSYVSGQFRSQLPKNSVLLSALDGWQRPPGAAPKTSETIKYLRNVIYRSELKHGIKDHFDTLLLGFSDQKATEAPGEQPDAKKQVRNANPQKTKGSLRWLKWIVLLLLLWPALVAGKILAERWLLTNHARVANAQFQASVPDVALLLPDAFANCLKRGDYSRCVFDESDLRSIAALDRARTLLLDLAAFTPLGGRDLVLLSTTAENNQCNNLAGDALMKELCNVLADLALFRTCLSVSNQDVQDGHCRTTARLGVVGSSHEFDQIAEIPIPVNVFDPPVTLPKTIDKLLELGDRLVVASNAGDRALHVAIGNSLQTSLLGLRNLIESTF